MKRYNIGLVRVVSFEDQDLLNIHGKIIEKYYPSLKITSKAIPNQSFGVYDDKTEALAVPKIIKLAKDWEGIDGMIISCAGDPAVKELREILDIPIIGAGESTALLSLRYGSKFGVLGITKEVPRAYKKIFSGNIVGKPDIEGINSTLDLMNKDGKNRVINAALNLKKLGAEVIALACTGMTTIGVAKELEQKLKIPVIDPVIAEGLIAFYEVLRNS